jgi:hypothetical protein
MQETTSNASALAIISESEINQQIATAKKYPRDIVKSIERTKSLVTQSESISVSCLYALPRGGKLLEDASVQFADILLSQWGNCRALARILDAERTTVRAQGIFLDLESNTSILREVERRIVSRSGERYSDDMIALAGNAAGRIAYRNAILAGIPRPFWQDIYRAARDNAGGPPEEFENRRTKMIDFFKSHGIREAQILGYVRETTGQDIRRIEYINRSHLILLRAYANSLSDNGKDEHSERKESSLNAEFAQQTHKEE